MPAIIRRQLGKCEIFRFVTGIEHEVNPVISFFMNKTGDLFAPWILPIGEAAFGAEPGDFGIGVELFLA
jgi:hypothetical protein